MGTISFLDENGKFTLKNPENYSGLYFPIAQNMGIKSALTPNLGGDAKCDQNSFLLEPVSIENLNNNRSVRNFWCNVEGKGSWSAVGASAKQEYEKFSEKQDESKIEAGFMKQTVTRESKEFGLKAEVLSFAPFDKPCEVMSVLLTNISDETLNVKPTAAIPIYARSADNIRDHRHVTSLLHRIRTTENGVYVKPTLSFDERGHRKNTLIYYVCGAKDDGEKPTEFFPATDAFIGEGGTLTNPRSIIEKVGGVTAGTEVAGKEALGGLGFNTISLKSGESARYTIVMGVSDNEEKIEKIVNSLNTEEKVLESATKTEKYWNDAVNVGYDTGNKEFDGFMKWVSFQPFLRRIFGCSFLPHHDYGRGGRGWRDLWQDCLSLLIMDPSGVRQMILDNYCGVRIDGTNATIIGEKQGEFVADRNGIARVWMDHGVWPFLTTKLYINQTGDIKILNEKATYFKDEQKGRGTGLDKEWNEEYGVVQKKENGEIYEGTILEHILLEQLCAFYEVGAHNHIKLRGADWNDALDMAPQNGESVAFTCAYAGNFSDLADLLTILEKEYGQKKLQLLEEIEILLNCDEKAYDSIEAKREVLSRYFEKCNHNVSGKTVEIEISKLAENLCQKAEWIKEHVRKTEWIEKDGEGWFNSYYDNHENKVEGYFESGVRMMLTGQVFSVMSKTAQDEQVKKICKSADRYLYKKEIGGYRLNTDFHEEKLDLGRMFGFAYGEKENGAVFSHMTVMYANALYQRGFVKEGYKALQTLADNAMNFETAKIYPGIPEYFDGDGRGLYHYLTGAASWYMLTFITEVFGVKGILGKLAINPKLVKEQFSQEGKAMLTLDFAGKTFEVTVLNRSKADFGEYRISSATCDDKPMTITLEGAILEKNLLEQLSDEKHKIVITLEHK